MGSFVFCCCLTTVAQLLLDFIKHALAHFAPFLAPILLLLTILCFKDTIIVFKDTTNLLIFSI